MVRPRTIALLYLLFATLAVLLFATTMPPMQNADEQAHAYRADQVSHLGLIGVRLADGQIGGDVDAGLPALYRATSALPFHPEAKVTREMYVAHPMGMPAPTGFPNTAIYPPFLYLPAAAMALAVRHLAIPLPHALVLMRLASGAASIALGAAAIALSGNAALWLFAVLLLPMSLSLDAAVSQDGPMLACVALAVALCLRMRVAPPAFARPAYLAMCALLAVVAMARPPYLAFALLTFAAPVPTVWRRAGLGAIAALTIVWCAINAGHLVLPVRPGGVVAPLAQLGGLLIHPQRLPALVSNTWQMTDHIIQRGFIGIPGWLDVNLPDFYHRLAWAALALSIPASLVAGRGGIALRSAALAALAILAAVIGVALIQYMTWTVVGSPVIDGIQGRYLLAPSLLLAVLLARRWTVPTRASAWLAAPVLILPVASIAVTEHALLIRYYF
jgi:uncharacterized membrane protein